MKKILLVEDDIALSAGLCFELEEEDYLTVAAHSLKKAGQLLETSKFDLLLLDVDLPDGNGFTFYKEIKKRYTVPVMFLTGRKEEEDVLGGYDLGADDYVTKPYNSQELLARVKSHLRRYTRLGDIHAASASKEFKSGRLCYHAEERVLYADGESIRLTATETKIVDLFMRNLGRVFSAEEIYRRVWEEDAFAPENTVMVHIRRIREKIELNPKEPEYLKVVWGIGYKIEKM